MLADAHEQTRFSSRSEGGRGDGACPHYQWLRISLLSERRAREEGGYWVLLGGGAGGLWAVPGLGSVPPWANVQISAPPCSAPARRCSEEEAEKQN